MQFSKPFVKDNDNFFYSVTKNDKSVIKLWNKSKKGRWTLGTLIAISIFCNQQLKKREIK